MHKYCHFYVPSMSICKAESLRAHDFCPWCRLTRENLFLIACIHMGGQKEKCSTRRQPDVCDLLPILKEEGELGF